MKKYFKIIYICFSMVILSLSLVLSFRINQNIFDQREILKKQQKELNYIISLNNKIEINNYNLQELELKNYKLNHLKNEQNILIGKENQLQNSINKYSELNKEIQEKIDYYK